MSRLRRFSLRFTGHRVAVSGDNLLTCILTGRTIFKTALLAFASGGMIVSPAQADPKKQAPMAAAIRDAASGKYEDFYAQRRNKLLWFVNGKPSVASAKLLTHIATSRADGLDPDDYDLDDVRTLIKQAQTGKTVPLARADVALSELFVRYVTDMREPEKVGMTFLDKSVKPRKRGTDTVLRAAAMAPSLDSYITNMGWMSPHYLRLRTMMARAIKSGSSAETRRRLGLNLERARILPSAYTHHIVVDSASGRLWYYQAGAQKGTMRVVVGKAESPTPMYAGVVQYAVLKPYWNVPVDLTQKLIAPKVVAGRTLSSMGFEALSDWSSTPQRLKQSDVDWKAVARGEREVRVRQLPGPKNSMGRVKFMFPNQTGIFLHDTPERGLFAKTARHFSNGCVRLEDAATLGQWLMGRPLPTKTAQADQAVSLTVPVPIYMTYFTATETKKGIGFLKDVYGRDK
jgi:L,D-transpeptidase YcbB